jgi:soluble lytic murein transglycosylase
MRRYLLISLTVFVVVSAVGLYFFNQYWIHRYDDLIARQAAIYRLDEKFVWSVIYEETYFRAWKIGAAEEVGLMQVTPLVAREWAKETGFREFEKQTAENVVEFLREPERNIQVGCWYLEKMREKYRGFSAEKAMTLAAYNAGASRVEEWTKNTDAANLPEAEFIEKINISTTKSYVSSILKRFYAQTPTNRIRRMKSSVRRPIASEN